MQFLCQKCYKNTTLKIYKFDDRQALNGYQMVYELDFNILSLKMIGSAAFKRFSIII